MTMFHLFVGNFHLVPRHCLTALSLLSSDLHLIYAVLYSMRMTRQILLLQSCPGLKKEVASLAAELKALREGSSFAAKQTANLEREMQA